MTKKDILIGFVIGILASILGSYLFITLFTNFSFISGIQIMKSEGKLGKIMTLGSILDLIAFAILLKLNKEIMARGVVLAVIIIAIMNFFA
jgi:cellulose synthase/poly-beta-1,6-N-acetylglucosamine synthase-like glycosyltransferase